MASVNLSNTGSVFSLYGINNKGIGGLASGLDTDEMMQALTLGTRSKIATQQSKRQTLLWQQTAYRNVASTIGNFKTNYFPSTSGILNVNGMAGNSWYDSYKATSTSSKVSVEKSTGNGRVEITSVLKLASNEKLTTNTSHNPVLEGDAITLSDSWDGKSFSIQVDDGTIRTIDLSSLDANNGSDAAFQAELQRLVDNAVGMRTALDSNGKPIPAGTGYQQESIVKVDVTGGVVTFTSDSKVAIENAEALGFDEPIMNRLDTRLTIEDVFGVTGNFEFTINGKSIVDASTGKPLTGSSTISALTTAVNRSGANVEMAYDAQQGTFSLTHNLPGAGANIEFEDVSGNLMGTIFGTHDDTASTSPTYTRIPGSNAEILVDGQVLTSENNKFNINNIQFTVDSLHNIDALSTADPIVLVSKVDADILIDKLTQFVDDYNALLYSLNSVINEKPDSNYPALSEEQKSQMTSDEIASWEAEAKKGLLYRDKTISGIISQMRMVMISSVESAGMGLYDIGITTESNLDSNYEYSASTNPGKLVINEERLRKAIEETPDLVRTLFNSDDTKSPGIVRQLNAVVESAIDASSNPNKRGSLIVLAGQEKLTGDNTSSIGNKIERLDTYISKLKTQLEKEYNRYWNKFSALESSIAKMNAQASWLTEFGS